MPCAIPGAFNAAKDVDHYTFHAEKDEKFLIEAFAERRAQLEAEKDLRPEDQHPGFVERGLDLFRQLHF